MPAAIRYIRFSSDSQQHGSSVARQSSMIDKWLAEHKEYVLSDLSASDLGKSGFKGEHLKEGAGLSSIIQAIHESKITKDDVILVEALDRLGRLEPLRMITLISEILASGVKIVTLEYGQAHTYSSESLADNMGELYMLVGKVQAAYNYSKTLSERVAAANENKQRAIENGESVTFINTPWWLDRKGMLIPENAEAVRWIITSYKQGASIRMLTKQLSSQWGLSLTKTAVSNALSSRALYGVYQDKKRTKLVRGAYEAVITAEEFNELQLIRTARGRSRSVASAKSPAISSFMRCGCGNGVHKVLKNKIAYVRCNSYGRTDGGCGERQYPFHIFQHCFYRFARKSLQHWARMERRNDYQDAISKLDLNLSEVREQLERLTDLFLETNSPEIKRRVVKVSETVDQLSKSRGELLAKASGESAAMDYRDEFLQAGKLLEVVQEGEQSFHDLLRLAGYQLTLANSLIISSTGHTVSINCYKRSLSAHLVSVKDHVNESQFFIRKDGCWKSDEGEPWSTLLDNQWSFTNWERYLDMLDVAQEVRLADNIRSIAKANGLDYESLSVEQKANLLIEFGGPQEAEKIINLLEAYHFGKGGSEI